MDVQLQQMDKFLGLCSAPENPSSLEAFLKTEPGNPQFKSFNSKSEEKQC